MEKLVHCRECGKEIADTAAFCSHCGAKQPIGSVAIEKAPPAKGKRPVASFIFSVLILLLALFHLSKLTGVLALICGLLLFPAVNKKLSMKIYALDRKWVKIPLAVLGLVLALAGFAAQDTVSPSGSSLLSKQSGFTLDDCLSLCDMSYDIQAQVNACQVTCAVLGKPSPTLDKLSLDMIQRYKQSHNETS